MSFIEKNCLKIVGGYVAFSFSVTLVVIITI